MNFKTKLVARKSCRVLLKTEWIVGVGDRIDRLTKSSWKTLAKELKKD